MKIQPKQWLTLPFEVKKDLIKKAFEETLAARQKSINLLEEMK